MKSLSATFIVITVCMFSGAIIARGQFILSPVAVTESGLGTFGPTTGLTNMINQSGFAGAPFVSGATAFDAYFTPNDKFSQNADNTKWQSALSYDLPLVGNLDFDLGASFRLNKIAIWNVSTKDVSIFIAETAAGLDTAVSVGSFTLTQNTSSLSLRADILDLGAEFQGRYVRLAVQSEYKYSPGDSWYYATIGEVAVSAQAAGSIPFGVALNQNGDVSVTFSGTLQSKANIEDTFQDVPGNPQGNYVVPKASQGDSGFFRTRN